MKSALTVHLKCFRQSSHSAILYNVFSPSTNLYSVNIFLCNTLLKIYVKSSTRDSENKNDNSLEGP